MGQHSSDMSPIFLCYKKCSKRKSEWALLRECGIYHKILVFPQPQPTRYIFRS